MARHKRNPKINAILKPRLRDNVGRFQKYATVHITKELKDIADEYKVNITTVVRDKLEETYKANVLASYAPRSMAGGEVASYNKRKKAEEKEAEEEHKVKTRLRRKKLTYRHTGTFLDSIDVVVEGDDVKVIIRDKKYPNEKSTVDVYDYLTKGTEGDGESTGDYTYEVKGETEWAYNYPTPAHLFEEHTKVQMKVFLDNIRNELKDPKYSAFRYTGKKKPRKFYKGESLK